MKRVRFALMSTALFNLCSIAFAVDEVVSQTGTRGDGDKKATQSAAISGETGSIESDIAAIEQLLKAGRVSQPYMEKVASQRLADWKITAEKGLPAGQFLYGRSASIGVGRS